MFTNLVRTKVNIIPPANGSKYYSARIYLEEHYANAVSNYEKGNIIRAFHQLGMACHYLADCGTPPHTAGIQFPLNPLAPNPHHVFEKYVDKHCDEYNATSAIGLYGSLDDAKLGYTVNYMAKKSSSYKDVVLSMDPLQYPKALPVSLGISQQYTAVLLEKFYRKVSSK
ncbi:phospholipase, putative [Trichomonas vaginalis G3]|uniref:Phospholipase C n=1 Tax=Trichomonas vaginalis (strain ATCC PRA-98 / G3) TaxID=412133 RepID=A2FM02_TRIV3|nr:p1 nuclease domain-containing protein [Trichomonas vaginalis G3]EAX94091.1 phospholipase, putative [Trichomonas vaginalis G3]KAI5488091.1 p1 nuclease domain-containing protein [Trichomonas vaginalis G3]|eukprot:XP_001307021.1 phospholipase [Trichomonas vaginalis G3]